MLGKSQILLVSLLLSSPLGCESTDPVTEFSSEKATLSVTPDGPLSVGFFEKRVLEVELNSDLGGALANQPVHVTFVGSAHNGDLSEDEIRTGENGKAQVTFTAPDQELSFSIRVSSPIVDEPVFVDVIVDPEQVFLELNVSYSGGRQIELITAEIFEDITCEEISDEDGENEIFAIKQADGLPAIINFGGLRVGKIYSVRLKGFNPKGFTRVSTCVSDLEPSQIPVNISLQENPLDLAGRFDISSQMGTDAKLDPAMEVLRSVLAFCFVDDPAKKILDAIHDELQLNDPFAALNFEGIRAEKDLDTFVTGEIGSTLQDEVDGYWDAVKNDLGEIVTNGQVEIGGDLGEGFELFHNIVSLSFPLADNLVIQIMTPEYGQGKALLDDMDKDLLIIQRHEIPWGLGHPIETLLSYEIKKEHPGMLLGQALAAIVDCEMIATRLAPKLDGVTSGETILTACVQAADTAHFLFDMTVTLMNLDGAIIMEGSAHLVEPTEDNHVQEMIDGQFTVHWSGTTVDEAGNQLIVEYGPMDASFEASSTGNP